MVTAIVIEAGRKQPRTITQEGCNGSIVKGVNYDHTPLERGSRPPHVQFIYAVRAHCQASGTVLEKTSEPVIMHMRAGERGGGPTGKHYEFHAEAAAGGLEGGATLFEALLIRLGEIPVRTPFYYMSLHAIHTWVIARNPGPDRPKYAMT
ncbi:hypothetical protein B0H17DRAFT_1183169 [Mycena rosella]|uniref:Uncharacterized protein n=1 Tax=Mycena rosella TaxID=1033263 RepID=A0AAD7D1C8_MYCRO|nr:hypothetical protein B0H17DRAFT_1183169 [Mycena rosella]